MTDIIESPLIPSANLYDLLYVQCRDKQEVADIYQTSTYTVDQYLLKYGFVPPYDNVTGMFAYIHANAAFAAANVLAGFDASSFANATHANSVIFVHANAAFDRANVANDNFTGANIINHLVTVDGSGSGLDADLLDGLDSTSFANATHANAYFGSAAFANSTFASASYANTRIFAHANSAYLQANVANANFTAANILSRLLTVDGAGSGLDADLLDGQTGTYYAAATHKYHTFTNGTYYFDTYEHSNFFRIFTENSTSDIIRFQTVSSLEYWDFVGTNTWATWAGGDISSILDGQESTGFALDHTHRKFRFNITQADGWPTLCLLALHTTWSGITWPGCTVMLEEDTDGLGSWVTRDTAVFTAANGATTWGVATKATSTLHTGIIPLRVTIEFTDWTDSGPYTTVPLRRLMILSNYSVARPLEPWTWNYGKVVTFNATPKAPTANSLTNDTTIATTAYVKSQNYVDSAANILSLLLTVDGSGSGLDADLVDGLNSTSFANATHANAYFGSAAYANATFGSAAFANATFAAAAYANTRIFGHANGAFDRANVANDNFTGANILNHLVTVDGSGSGLDADFVDGLDSTSFANATHANSYFASASYANATFASAAYANTRIFAHANGAFDRANVANANFTGANIKNHLVTVDGAGSGLDADLLDGFSWPSPPVIGGTAANSATFTTATLTGGQLIFPATQNASAGVNTLDDYEEGTFTATLRGVTADPTTPVTTTGVYTKVGRVVFFSIAFDNVTTTGASGQLRITGLPFSAASTFVTGNIMIAHIVGFANQLVGYINSTLIDFYYNVSLNNWAVANHNPGTSRYLWVSGHYHTST